MGITFISELGSSSIKTFSIKKTTFGNIQSKRLDKMPRKPNVMLREYIRENNLTGIQN
jgi:hypothetical protein